VGPHDQTDARPFGFRKLDLDSGQLLCRRRVGDVGLIEADELQRRWQGLDERADLDPVGEEARIDPARLGRFIERRQAHRHQPGGAERGGTADQHLAATCSAGHCLRLQLQTERRHRSGDPRHGECHTARSIQRLEHDDSGRHGGAGGHEDRFPTVRSPLVVGWHVASVRVPLRRLGGVARRRSSAPPRRDHLLPFWYPGTTWT
jgi:hypothetical protein